MKFAVVSGERLEAQPGLSATCPVCEAAVVAKCGEHRAWHWAHRGVRNCDVWWEPETEWHRAWKNHFPAQWQEIIRHAEDGEKHIADILTESGTVIEFQHSNLRRDERESRENFYKAMVWVVDGTRRLRDRARFYAALDCGRIVNPHPLIVAIQSSEGALLRDWAPCRVPVFFDFGDACEPNDALRFDVPVLWRLDPQTLNGTLFLSPVVKASFHKTYIEGTPLGIFDASAMLKRVAAPQAQVLPQHLTRPGGFQNYLARQDIRRGRRRF